MTDLTPRTGPDDDTTTPKRRRNVLPMIVLALVLVAGGVIVTQFLRSAVDYYCNVDEVGVRDGCDEDRRLRLQGVVERGIHKWRNAINIAARCRPGLIPPDRRVQPR